MSSLDDEEKNSKYSSTVFESQWTWTHFKPVCRTQVQFDILIDLTAGDHSHATLRAMRSRIKCGFSRCQSLSQNRGILRNPVLFVTAVHRSEDIQKRLFLPCDPYGFYSHWQTGSRQKKPLNPSLVLKNLTNKYLNRLQWVYYLNNSISSSS